MSTVERMSDAEGLMWRLEKDPRLTSTFANVTILDRPMDFDRFLARMERAVAAVPRLRWRVEPAPGGLGPPSWAEDPDFDLRYHVRHLALPKPGTRSQLFDLGTAMASDAFDRTRPLWEFVVVDGLRGGKGALVQKMHHTITDGEGGMRLSMQFLDLERDAPPPPPLGPADLEAIAEAEHPGPVDTARDFVAGAFRLPLTMARQTVELLSDPVRIPGVTMTTVQSVKGVVDQLGDTQKARSPLWTARSLRRHLEVVRAPFEATKAASQRLGGSLNTAFLTAAAAGAGAYHRRMGSPVDDLRASMAISTRGAGSGANSFTLGRMMVPTGEMDVRERFSTIHEASQATREASASASLDALAAVASALPTSLVTRLARQQAETVDFATSNVRGSPIPLFLAGAQILENYPIGPLLGVAFNLTLLSYAGSLDMGVHLDPAAVAEPELLRRCLEAAFAELIAVA